MTGHDLGVIKSRRSNGTLLLIRFFGRVMRFHDRFKIGAKGELIRGRRFPNDTRNTHRRSTLLLATKGLPMATFYRQSSLRFIRNVLHGLLFLSAMG